MPVSHMHRNFLPCQKGGPEWIAEQHEMLASAIEVAIVKRGARQVQEGSAADQEMALHLPGWRALFRDGWRLQH